MTSLRWVPLLTTTTLLASACATKHSSQALPDGVTIHTFRREYANAHVISKGDAFFMVDAGLEANAPMLAEDLRAAGFDPAKLRGIVLSHGHADHAGGAGYFKKTFATRIIAGKGDSAMLATGKNDTICPTDAQAKKRAASDQAATYSPFAADVLIDTDTSLEALVGIPGQLVPLPGHTEGTIIISLPDAKATLVGDLFRGAIVGSSAEVHFYMCDLDDNKRDIATLLHELSPEADTFFTGHFGPVARSAVSARF